MKHSVNFLELIGGGRIPEVLIGTWIVMGILIVFGFIARASIAGAADPVVPDEGLTIRSASEMIVEWLDGFVSEVTEMHGSRAMVPVLRMHLHVHPVRQPLRLDSRGWSRPPAIPT